MSNINIKRAVENIRANTTVYTPVVEMIVNAIQAIDESGRTDGKVSVRALRNSQAELFGSLPDVTSFDIQDNGIGFTDEHRDSFDTLYTDRRIGEGGKGFGRFTCLKYFEDLHVKSVYREGSGFKCRSFSMGKDHDIIVREETMVSERCFFREVLLTFSNCPTASQHMIPTGFPASFLATNMYETEQAVHSHLS